jgi:hypothetical protein
MRAVQVALLATLIAVPAAAQKKPVAPPAPAQKAAPAPAMKGNMQTLLVFEQRIQEYADRVSIAADRGESMAIVNNSMNAIAQCLKGADKHLTALQAAPQTPADAKKLAQVAKFHAQAHTQFEALGAELKKEYASRASVLRISYALSDAAVQAQGKVPPKHPVIKAEPVKPKG